MTRKKKARAYDGWVLMEVLCSVVMVSVIAGLIIESSCMMARASARGMEIRTRTLDFSSIAGEAERVSSSVLVSRGSWRATAEVCAGEKGIRRVEVSMSLEPDEASGAICWTAWDISGRAR